MQAEVTRFTITIPAGMEGRRFTVDGALDYELAFVFRNAADEKSEKAARLSDDLKNGTRPSCR